MRTDSTTSVTTAVNDLLAAVTGLVSSVRTAVASSPGVAAAKGRVAASVRSVGDAAATKSKKLGSALKSYWANLTPAQKKARVDAILRGRGLLGKKKGGAKEGGASKGSSAKAGGKGRRGQAAGPAPANAKPAKARKNPWANLTPEQRAERVKKMQAGRAKKTG